MDDGVSIAGSQIVTKFDVRGEGATVAVNTAVRKYITAIT